MGKMIILKAMTYTPPVPSDDDNNNNQGGGSDNQENQGGNTGNENQGGGNGNTQQPEVPVELSILFSPTTIDLNVTDNDRSPLAYTAAGYPQYNTTRVAAVDVSQVRGRTVRVTHATSNDDGYAFVTNTSARGDYDIANIENWVMASAPEAINSFRAVMFHDYSLGYAKFESTTQDLVVPSGAKWLIFGTNNMAATSVEVIND